MKYWILMLSLNLASFSLQAEQIYQWVDENGNLQFSQTPPPTGIDASTREITAPSSGEDENVSSSGATENQEKEVSDKVKDTLEQITPEQLRQYNCEKAKEHLKLLQNQNAAVAKLPDNQENNGVKILTPEQRKAEIKAAEGHVKEYCSPPKAKSAEETE